MVRPSRYSELIAREILSRYGDGEALSKMCKDKNISKRNTVYRWRYSHPRLGDQAGEIVDTEQDPLLAKVRSEFLRWLSSKLNRSKYGDKLDVNYNVTMDVAPVLVAAAERQRTLGVTVIGVPAEQLEEAGSDTM